MGKAHPCLAPNLPELGHTMDVDCGSAQQHLLYTYLYLWIGCCGAEDGRVLGSGGLRDYGGNDCWRKRLSY